MTFIFFQKRIKELLKNKKVFVFKLVLPSILLLPLFFTPANVYFIAAVTTFFVVIFGFFGAGENLGRERTRGSLQKIAVAPISSSGVIFGEVAAHFLFGIVQFLPVLVLILIKVPPNLTFPIALAYLISFFCTILSANTLGILLTPILPEFRTIVFLAMLFPLMVFSGVFVSLKSWLQVAVAKFLPPSYLYQSTLLVFAKESIFSSREVIILSLLLTLFILVLTSALSKKIVR